MPSFSEGTEFMTLFLRMSILLFCSIQRCKYPRYESHNANKSKLMCQQQKEELLQSQTLEMVFKMRLLLLRILNKSRLFSLYKYSICLNLKVVILLRAHFDKR